MPRAARFKIAAIEELLRQLEYAPVETRRRQMDAAERLVADLDPLQNYPQEFIVYRITNYRSDRVDDPITFVGEALLPDLVNLVQVLSQGLELKASEEKRRVLSMEEVAQRLQVSHKSIQRYRKQGLVCHYLIFPDGVARLGCFHDALERFTTGRRERLEKAASFTRMESEVEARIIEEARELRQTRKLSLNEAARLLAQQHERAHETIRMLLRRHDRRADQPIFADRGPLTERDTRLIYRAWQWGVEPARLAQRFGKSKATIHRAVNRRRRDLLRTVELKFIALPTFDWPDAAAIILAAPAVVSGLDQNDGRSGDALAWLEAAHTAPSAGEDGEDALLAAFNFLKRRASMKIAALGEWPTSEELDLIETDLRWAALLRRRLVMLGFPAALRRIEQNLGRPLKGQPAEPIVSMLNLAVRVIAQAVEAIDPARGQRLERVAGFAMERSLATLDLAKTMTRAAARHLPGSIALDDPLASLNGWEKWLNPRRDLRNHVAALDELAADAMTLRYGWSGEPPLTCISLAKRLGLKPVGVARLLQRAIRDLRAASRGAE